MQKPKYRTTTFSNFSASGHTRAIQRGRSVNTITSLNKRLCGICNGIDDEVHFLVDCQVISNERQALFTKIHEKVTNILNFFNKLLFTFLLKSTDTQICPWTSEVIHIGLKKTRSNCRQWFRSRKICSARQHKEKDYIEMLSVYFDIQFCVPSASI